MTFIEAEKRLKNISDEEFDRIGAILAKLHSKLEKTNHEAAEAIELAFMSMGLYCKK